MNIFDLVTADAIAAYWDELAQDRAPYLGEELFPNDKKLGLDLKWIKGSNGLPVVLRNSAFDAQAIPRPRINFEQVMTEMPFFKESTYIDEEMRQQLNMVMESSNELYRDTIINRIFADETRLLEGAAAQRERMRMMALTSGVISISANGQDYTYDYGIPDDNKKTVTLAWSDPEADIINDVMEWQDQIEDETGVRPTRAVVSRKTWSMIVRNYDIRNGVLGNDSRAPISDTQARQYISLQLDLEIVVYTKRYIDESGNSVKYVPDDTFVMFPTGFLGNTWFGTTPEESDLMTGSIANVSVTDTGVAVTTSKKIDPVNVETKVSMICLPSFPMADKVIIADIG